MAIIRVAPVDVEVRTDWFNGRSPRDHLGRRATPDHPRRRGPRRAFRLPGDHRPRTLFEVDTPLVRLALTYRHRSRRWLIEGLDEVAKAA